MPSFACAKFCLSQTILLIVKQYAFSLNWIENGTKLVMSFMRHYLIFIQLLEKVKQQRCLLIG